MARWTGEDNIGEVLAAADAWRERCILEDDSLFRDGSLWTLDNLEEFKSRFVGNPIEGAERSFYDKLEEQLSDAAPEVKQIAAEILWFYLLFPHYSKFGPETKREQIKQVWEWSGSDLPDSPYLQDKELMGVGNPGTAYLTRRHEELSFFLEFAIAWKSLSDAEREELMTDNIPWRFMEWLDQIEGAERRPTRNAVLYFLFPDQLERNLSNDHRRQIVQALKHKLPEDLSPKGQNLSLQELDRAIFELRNTFADELGTEEIDFYRPPIYAQWWIGIREKARSEISAGLKKVLSEYDLELRQCGSKKKTLETCKPVDEKTGFWASPADATNKPLRWIVHFELVDDDLLAKVADEHGSRRIAFANTAQGTSGAVTTRIIPAIKVGDEKYVFYETWEWLLLHAFLPALPIGSSGQLLEDFNPETGRLEYMGHEQQYIAAGLIALNEDDDLFLATELPRALKYSEATAALAKLIHVAPTVEETEAEETAHAE